MPKDIIKKFQKQYGKEKGKKIYYATANKQGRDPETFQKESSENNFQVCNEWAYLVDDKQVCPNCLANNDENTNPWSWIFDIENPILVGKDGIKNFCCVCDELKKLDPKQLKRLDRLTGIDLDPEEVKNWSPYFGSGEKPDKADDHKDFSLSLMRNIERRINETVCSGAVAMDAAAFSPSTPKKRKTRKKNKKKSK